jgi:hypothetical protein
MVTVPYTDSELSGLSEADKFFAQYDKRGKVIGEESIGVFAADSLEELAAILASQVEKFHPTPLVVLDTDNFRESFIFKRVSRKDPAGIKETIGYVPARREIIFEKKCQLWREMGVESIVEVKKFCEQKMLEAAKKGLRYPRQYLMEEIAKKYPGSAAYIKEIGLGHDLRITMADPRSRIYYRLIGKDKMELVNNTAYYEKFHSLVGRISHVSNEIMEE